MPVEASGSKSLKYLSIFGQCGECLGLCVSLQLPFFPPYEVLQFWVPETPLPGFPGGGTVVKTLPANGGDTRDVDLIPESGRSPIEGNRNPLQHSCLENSMDRGAWRAAVHGVPKSRTRLSMHVCTSPWKSVCADVWAGNLDFRSAPNTTNRKEGLTVTTLFGQTMWLYVVIRQAEASTWWAPSESPGHWTSDELPWLAALHMCCHSQLLQQWNAWSPSAVKN